MADALRHDACVVRPPTPPGSWANSQAGIAMEKFTIPGMTKGPEWPSGQETSPHNSPQRKAVRPQDTRALAVGESLGNGNLREAGGGPAFSIGQSDMPGRGSADLRWVMPELLENSVVTCTAHDLDFSGTESLEASTGAAGHVQVMCGHVWVLEDRRKRVHRFQPPCIK
ncbi:hypothetical protein VTN00DRAFT_856 [Thermoascus crustaceus]|uniref:uncharacterized protein n=1 Tax=Thermoascus crustaceus TaxID=5088 RepID=UPI003743ECDD